MSERRLKQCFQKLREVAKCSSTVKPTRTVLVPVTLRRESPRSKILYTNSKLKAVDIYKFIIKSKLELDMDLYSWMRISQQQAGCFHFRHHQQNASPWHFHRWSSSYVLPVHWRAPYERHQSLWVILVEQWFGTGWNGPPEDVKEKHSQLGLQLHLNVVHWIYNCTSLYNVYIYIFIYVYTVYIHIYIVCVYIL